MSDSPSTGKPLKVSLVGDGAVGKDCLRDTHTTGTFPTTYVPTVFDNTIHDEMVDGITYCLDIWVTAGKEDYDRLRPQCYTNTSVFIVCFSLNSINSFTNIPAKWLPELRANCPNVPVLLVGTKKDVRDVSVISSEDGQRLCQKEGLVQYLECSAKTREGLAEVFQVAAKAAKAFEAAKSFKAAKAAKKSQMCCIL